MFSKIVSGHGSHIDTFGEFEVLRFTLDLSSRDNAKTIRVSELERDHEVRIIAFERADGSASSIPTPDSLLYAGDSILACVRHDVIAPFHVTFWIRWYPCTSLSLAAAKSGRIWLASC